MQQRAGDRNNSNASTHSRHPICEIPDFHGLHHQEV